MQQIAQRDWSLNKESFAHPKRNVSTLGLRHGMRVADFGAGSGAYVFSIAEQLQGSGTIYAIDVQRELLRRIHNEAARRGYKNIEVIWADLETPRASKLADGSIDLVLISDLLFQVGDKQLPLREARRIVKPAGHVIVIDWSDSYGGMGPIKEDVVPKDAALSLSRMEHLELEREFPAGAYHYGLILRPIAQQI